MLGGRQRERSWRKSGRKMGKELEPSPCSCPGVAGTEETDCSSQIGRTLNHNLQVYLGWEVNYQELTFKQ